MICTFKVIHCYLQMYLKTFEINVLKYMHLILLIFYQHQKTEAKLELLTDIDMLLMVQKGIRGGIFHVIHRNAKANKKYMKEYNKDNESSYIM